MSSRLRHESDVEVIISPPEAEVSVDGEIREGSPSSRIALDAGTHVLVASHPRYLPEIIKLKLAAGEKRRVEVALIPAQDRDLGHGVLAVECATPGVSVEVDGRRRAITPLEAPLVLARGNHKVRLNRDGYATTERFVQIQQGRTVSMGCALMLDPRATAFQGWLNVLVSEPDAVVSVDGRPYRGERLAQGIHALTVERDGFVVHHGVVSVSAGRRRSLKVTLRPTATTVRQRRTSLRSRRIWALGAGALGAALGGAAITTAAWNHQRYEDWKRERSQFDQALLRGLSPSEASFRTGSITTTAAEIQRTDDVALGMALAAGGALASASILWLTAWLDGDDGQQ
jgi:hypothetical protein